MKYIQSCQYLEKTWQRGLFSRWGATLWEIGNWAPPLTTDAEKIPPDRAIATERLATWGGRYVNLFAPKVARCRPEFAKIEAIAERIASLQRAHPGVPILINKRDITSASKFPRIHPDGVKLPPAELTGSYFGLHSSVIELNLVLPFGWSGSPGCVGGMASAIPKWDNAHGPSYHTNSGPESFTSFMFADGGILIEPDVGTR